MRLTRDTPLYGMVYVVVHDITAFFSCAIPAHVVPPIVNFPFLVSIGRYFALQRSYERHTYTHTHSTRQGFSHVVMTRRTHGVHSPADASRITSRLAWQALHV